MTLAKAFVTGVVVKAPEKRFTQNDMAIADFTLNIDTNNETLVRVVSYGQVAENIASTISSGDSVAVEGRLQINTFKLPNGKEKRVYEISSNSVEKMSVGTATAKSVNNENIVTFNQEEVAQDLIDEDEIPF